MADLRHTKKAMIGGIVVSKFPLILTNEKCVHWVSFSYFLQLHERGESVSSIYTYAKHILDLISQLEVENKKFDEVDNDWIVAYSLNIKSRINYKGVENTKYYAAQVLSTVLRFMCWLECEGYITGVIGESKLHAIRITINKGKIQHSTTKNNSYDKGKNNAPLPEWIEAIKPYGPVREDLSARFELMIDWGISLGLRADEICALKLSQLPDIDSVDKALDENRTLRITLTKTKGGKVATIPVSPLLVKMTWDYISCYRGIIVSNVIKKNNKKNIEYVESECIFLSNKTGDAIKSLSFSNSVRSAFLQSIKNRELTLSERVWLHGLRHAFVVTTEKEYSERGVNNSLNLVKSITRHGSFEAMSPYLSRKK